MPSAYEIEVAEWEAIVARDEATFERWVTRCENPLRRSLYNYVLVVDVEVVVQEAALRVWDLAATIRPDGRSGFLFRWAVTVARNSARTHARRKGFAKGAGLRGLAGTDLEPLEDPPAPEGVRDLMLRARIAECVRRLSGNPRKVIGIRVTDGGGRKDQELAASLGMKFDTFRKNLERGRRVVALCLRGFGIDLAERLT